MKLSRYGQVLNMVNPHDHREYSVIERSLQKIIGSKKCALDNLSLNFTEVKMTANKVIPENLLCD